RSEGERTARRPARLANALAGARRPAGESLLLVELDDVARPAIRLARVQARRTTGLALMEQVVAAVELDLDHHEPLVLRGGQPVAVTGVLPQLLLLVGQGVDPPEDLAVDHRLLPSTGLGRRPPFCSRS